MGKVGSAVLYGPILHRVRHSVGHFIIQAAALIDGLLQRGIHLVGQPRFHHAVVKHQTAKIFRNCAHYDPLLF